MTPDNSGKIADGSLDFTIGTLPYHTSKITSKTSWNIPPFLCSLRLLLIGTAWPLSCHTHLQYQQLLVDAGPALRRLPWKCGTKASWAPTCLFMVQFQPCIQTEVQLSLERWATSWQATVLFTPVQTAYKTSCFHTRVQASFIDIFLKSPYYPHVKDLSYSHMPVKLHKFPILQLFLLNTLFFFFKETYTYSQCSDFHRGKGSE